MLREKRIAKTTLGIEYSPQAAAKALEVVDDLKIGDVETVDLSDWKRSVDLLLCLDVLEHLHDPWTTVRKLASCVKPGGRIVASIPNVQHKSVLFQLIRGQWKYEESGLLDRTHLRFFTRQTARKLIECGGFVIESESYPKLGPKSKILNAITLGAISGFLVVQYFIVARLDKMPA
jgi:2-polyprenyl-3-methyl-5-hydroxy-6-metoxy-1,4-benzoquinol methylase